MSTRLEELAVIMKTASRAKKAMTFLAAARVGVAALAAVTAGIYAVKFFSHGK